MTDIDYPDILTDPAGNLGLRQVKAWERIATALEQLVLAGMPASPATMPQEARELAPWDNAPTPPTPNYQSNTEAHAAAAQRFAESRNMPTQPIVPQQFAPLDTWQCPVHHSRKVVPAGTSKRTGAPYDAFVSCTERDCNQKPPR